MRLRWLILELTVVAFLLVCCRTTRSAESHSEETAKIDAESHEVRNEVTTVTHGPEHEVVTVEEFAPSEEVMPSAEHQRMRGSSGTDSLGQPVTQGVVTQPEHGPLVKRTTTVIDTGPSTQESHVEAQSATESHETAKTDMEAHSASETKPGLFSFGFGFKLALLLVGLGAAAWFLRKLWLPRL